jgi:hypothetical protein
MDEKQTAPSEAEKAEPKEAPPRMFHIHNTSRSRFNRALRAASPEHGGHKQYIGGEHRLVRGRPLVMSEAQIKKHLPELAAKKAQGLIDVKTPDGLSIDLRTGRVAQPSTPSLPLPNPPLDSVQRDKPAGNYRPQIQGGLPETMGTGDPSKVPDLVASAVGDEEDDETEGTEPPVHNMSGIPTQPHVGGKKKKGKHR